MVLAALSALASGKQQQWEVDFPYHTVRDNSATIELQWKGEGTPPDTTIARITYNGQRNEVLIIDGKGSYSLQVRDAGKMEVRIDEEEHSGKARPIAPWVSVIPPLLAILMALIFREVYSALFIGLLIGTAAIAWSSGLNILSSIGQGFLMIADTYLIEAAFDKEHLSIIIFSMLIGGMVHVISRNGGMQGVVNILSRFATNRFSTQIVTWLMGIGIFFDDYANTLVVGNTMRPVTDRMKISREKLAYIVDSTAAPIASVAFITTWIGAELSYIQGSIRTLGLDETAFAMFLNSLQYAYYPIFTLVFVFLLIRSGREFGPMLNAERRARKGEVKKGGEDRNENSDIKPAKDIRPAWYNAVAPVLVVIFGAIAGLVVTGLEHVNWSGEKGLLQNLSHVIGASDSFTALLWSSLAGAAVAVMMSVSQRLLSLRESMESLIDGFKSLLTAIIILILAWSLALITEHLHTAEFLSGIMVDMQLSPFLVPAITFILAALVSFSTGSSWGTMAILYPLILPSAWMIGENTGLESVANIAVFHNTISAVLAGSVLGDHCSPISDTTILSSLASSCDHVEHVRTQLPYALSVGAVALFVGTLPAAYGLSPWIIFPSGLVVLFLLTRFVARPVQTT